MDISSGNDKQFAIEAMAIEIVSFPIYSRVIFHSYVNVYQRVNMVISKVAMLFITGYRQSLSTAMTTLWCHQSHGWKIYDFHL